MHLASELWVVGDVDLQRSRVGPVVVIERSSLQVLLYALGYIGAFVVQS
ncbi:hypothetical protein [Onishia niordana]|nr:hypothetical protein [Halomonas niordiana]